MVLDKLLDRKDEEDYDYIDLISDFFLKDILFPTAEHLCVRCCSLLCVVFPCLLAPNGKEYLASFFFLKTIFIFFLTALHLCDILFFFRYGFHLKRKRTLIINGFRKRSLEAMG